MCSHCSQVSVIGDGLGQYFSAPDGSSCRRPPPMWAEPWVGALQQTHLIALACISIKTPAEPCRPLLSGNRPILLSELLGCIPALLGFSLYSAVLLPSEGSPTITSHCQANQAGSHLPAHH